MQQKYQDKMTRIQALSLSLLAIDNELSQHRGAGDSWHFDMRQARKEISKMLKTEHPLYDYEVKK